MKSTEQISNEGKYASKQSQQKLSHRKLNTPIYLKQATAGHQAIKCIDTKQNKWSPSLCGQNTVSNPDEIVMQNRTKDWFMSAKNYHAKSEPSKDTAAMLITTTKFVHQTNFNVENVSNPKFNHSSDTKALTTSFVSAHTPSIINRHRTEPKHQSQIKTQQQQKLKSSLEINRNCRQTNSFNGNDEHVTENSESLHKSITNHMTLGNSSSSSTSSKLNENSKSKKQPLSERRCKQKGETKTIQEKKKSTNNGKQVSSSSKKCSQQDPSQRLPMRLNENDTFGSIASSSNTDRYNKRTDKEWHSPESYMYDDISSDTLADFTEQSSSCMQTFWFRDIPNENLLTREQRLENKRDNLRRQAFQYAQAQHFRSTILAKRRLITVTKALAKFKNERNKASPTKCSVQSCSLAALAMTAYCYLHITLNKDQKLFHPCTAKFSDNSQCRVPVFDISHELPLCCEHAWKRDNYNRISQEQKPKKTLKTKTKSNESVRQPKRNKRKKKRNQSMAEESQIVSNQQQIKTIAQLNTTVKQTIQPTINVVWNQEFYRKAENPQIISAKSPALVNSVSKYLPENVMVYQLSSNSIPNTQKVQIQNILSLGENSSAYESSEDTGVGELSESELMTAQDGIEIPLGDARLLEEHDLTNVLNQLPVDAFNDLFQVQQHDHYEPTQKEQDELARALEEVDEQVKSLEQMTSSSNFLDNFLDVNDEILDGSDICDEVLTTSSVKNDIRGLVHT